MKCALITLLVLFAAPAVAEQIRMQNGQPICSDQDSLQTLLLAAIMHQQDPTLPAPNVPCEFAKAGAVAEVIERMPSGTNLARVIKVSVRAPGRAPMVGFTIEINR